MSIETLIRAGSPVNRTCCHLGINPPGALENLDHGDVFRDIQYLPGPLLTVFQEDFYDLAERCPFHAANKDQGPETYAIVR